MPARTRLSGKRTFLHHRSWKGTDETLWVVIDKFGVDTDADGPIVVWQMSFSRMISKVAFYTRRIRGHPNSHSQRGHNCGSLIRPFTQGIALAGGRLSLISFCEMVLQDCFGSKSLLFSAIINTMCLYLVARDWCRWSTRLCSNLVWSLLAWVGASGWSHLDMLAAQPSLARPWHRAVLRSPTLHQWRQGTL